MALLDDKLMTLRPRPWRRSLVRYCIPVLSVVFAVGCTSDSDEATSPSMPESSPGQHREPSSETSDRAEKRLGKQVEEALGTEEVSDGDPVLVEAGLERVGDGFHTEPELTRGRSYKLAVVCAGQGKITLSVSLKDPVRQTVDCDGVSHYQRITASAAKVAIVAEGMSGATGMVGWRLDKADK
ncbi:hypothetical protein [Streptomyces sp. NPDC052042]|uniref:hypothetical protein n=1 Tax=Streptomyces sp. NPDC052042 TaxID=3365683 RepID=UPI0037D09E70